MPSKSQVYLAVDLGAASGRVVAGLFDGGRIELREVSRFSNEGVKESDGWHWNFDRLFSDTVNGLRQAVRECGDSVISIGVDAWGLDYGLLDDSGRLLTAPFQYRDTRTRGMQELAYSLVPREKLYARTGIQFLFINTLYQLLAELKTPARINRAARLLFIPDLFHWRLTGKCSNEKSNASTSQLLDPHTQQWDRALIQDFGLPDRIFAETSDAGTELGVLTADLVRDIGARPRVVLPATHDTASAVLGVPATEDDPVFISSGTWSLLGREIRGPLLSDAAREFGFSNEGGAFGTTRFLKNIAGMWLLQESKRVWDAHGSRLDYEGLMRLANEAQPFAAVIDPNAPEFEAPGNMIDAIHSYCARTGQHAPEEPGAMTRMILESLVLKYGEVSASLEKVTRRPIQRVYVVGGGSKNAMLNQFTADSLNCEVAAGPAEATSLGNIIMQVRAAGEIESLADVRELARRSAETAVFEPRRASQWDDARGAFEKVIANG